MMLLWVLSSRTCGFNSKFKFLAVTVEDHEATRGQGAVAITATKGNDNNHSVIWHWF